MSTEHTGQLTLTHSPAEGTQLHGSRRCDGTAEILRSVAACSWRWSRVLGGWYVPRSRDRAVRRYELDATAAALRAAGRAVLVELGDERRSPAEQENDRAQRSGERSELLAERAERKDAEADALWGRAETITGGYPMGQPILVGHHSEKRHRRDLDRAHTLEGRAVAAHAESIEAARQSTEAAAGQSHRLSGPATERRIATMEAELRRLQRRRDGHTRTLYTDARGVRRVETQQPAIGAHRDEVEAEVRATEDQLRYWREHLAHLQAEGHHRRWSREDFTRGDYVASHLGWHEVVRVNSKSLTIPSVAGGDWTDRLSFDKVRGWMTAAERHARFDENWHARPSGPGPGPTGDTGNPGEQPAP